MVMVSSAYLAAFYLCKLSHVVMKSHIKLLFSDFS